MILPNKDGWNRIQGMGPHRQVFDIPMIAGDENHPQTPIPDSKQTGYHRIKALQHLDSLPKRLPVPDQVRWPMLKEREIAALSQTGQPVSGLVQAQQRRLVETEALSPAMTGEIRTDRPAGHQI